MGNGHERDFMDHKNVYILDVYNRGIYPHDGFAKRAIKRKVELGFFTEDAEYLNLVKTHVEGALNEFTPDIVVYNAGTDILDGDPLGCLSISPAGIIERDQIVFQRVRTRGIPILMVTSGGYQRTTARIIANSILNLKQLGLIQCQDAENHPPSPEPEILTIPRSSSEGTGFWARFRRSTNCSFFTRSATADNLAELEKESESIEPVHAKSTEFISQTDNADQINDNEIVKCANTVDKCVESIQSKQNYDTGDEVKFDISEDNNTTLSDNCEECNIVSVSQGTDEPNIQTSQQEMETGQESLNFIEMLRTS